MSKKQGENPIMKNNNQSFDTISLTVLYFASLAEQAGTDSEIVQVDSDDLVVIYKELSIKYSFDLPQNKVSVAINHEFGSWDDSVLSGDTIAFIPPVAGG